jgi:hypothetical protein
MAKERVLARFAADRAAYVRTHLWMAAAGMAGSMAVLWALGNADWWVGAPAAALAIAVRGGYLASEALADVWELTPRRLRGPRGRDVPLADLAEVRTLGSAVQLVTRKGDKHLIRYLADAPAAKARIEAAR